MSEVGIVFGMFFDIVIIDVKVGCVGILIYCFEVWLVDFEGQFVVDGVVGEIQLKGLNLFIGIW